MIINREVSRHIANDIDAQSKQCWANAMRGIKMLPDSLYCEGYAVVHGDLAIEHRWIERDGAYKDYSVVQGDSVIEHGWIEHDGAIVDPTLLDADVEYSLGLTFTHAELHKMIQKLNLAEMPLFYAFGWGGGDCLEMMTAYNDAYGSVHGATWSGLRKLSGLQTYGELTS